jgi:hypothetical protein
LKRSGALPVSLEHRERQPQAVMLGERKPDVVEYNFITIRVLHRGQRYKAIIGDIGTENISLTSCYLNIP